MKDSWLKELTVSITKGTVSTVTAGEWNLRFGLENSETRLFRILDGGGVYHCCGKFGVFTPGRFYLLPACCELDFHTTDFIALAWLHLDLIWRRELNLFNVVEPHPVELDLDSDGAAAFDGAARSWESGPREYWQALAVVCDLLGECWQEAPFVLPQDNDRRLRRMTRALRLMESGGRRNVGDLAVAAGMGESQFFAEFKALFGTTPARYMLLRRLERAKRLLVEKECKLQWIADECGFGDAFHFSKTFKREFGISPGVYRQSARAGHP